MPKAADRTTGEAEASIELSQGEREALRKRVARRAIRSPAPRLKVRYDDGEAPTVEVDHADPVLGTALLMEALGTADAIFFNGYISQLVNAGTTGRKVTARELNFMLSLIDGIGPRDPIEAMLAAQMAAVHCATMTFARRLNHVDNIPQQDSAARGFTKLARTFIDQLEALNRHRGKGQQKVTVEHVHVHKGGQAIVGTVEQGGGAARKSEDQAHAKPIAHAPEPTMRREDEKREPLPSTRRP